MANPKLSVKTIDDIKRDLVITLTKVLVISHNYNEKYWNSLALESVSPVLFRHHFPWYMIPMAPMKPSYFGLLLNFIIT